MLRGVKVKIHPRDVDELRLMAYRLRQGVLKLPRIRKRDTPSPMEPWHSGQLTVEVRVPEERTNTIKAVARKLNELRQKEDNL